MSQVSRPNKKPPRRFVRRGGLVSLHGAFSPSNHFLLPVLLLLSGGILLLPADVEAKGDALGAAGGEVDGLGLFGDLAVADEFSADDVLVRQARLQTVRNIASAAAGGFGFHAVDENLRLGGNPDGQQSAIFAGVDFRRGLFGRCRGGRAVAGG